MSIQGITIGEPGPMTGSLVVQDKGFTLSLPALRKPSFSRASGWHKQNIPTARTDDGISLGSTAPSGDSLPADALSLHVSAFWLWSFDFHVMKAGIVSQLSSELISWE